MNTSFLLGVPGKLKTLVDRLTSARAGYLDNLPTINTNAARLTSARAGYIDYLPTINSRVTAAVATASALATVDSNVDTIKTAVGAQAVRYAHGTVTTSDWVQVLSVSGSGYFTYFNTDDTSFNPIAQIVIDGETAVNMTFCDGDYLAPMMMGPARFTSSLVVNIYGRGSSIHYNIGYLLDQ